jgi:hypothetical protein
MRRVVLISVAAAIGCLFVAASASASSIVFIKGGNIWLSSPDGSVQRQVTVDGGYSSPSQADDGNIVALHNGQFVHLDRHGTPLNPPVDRLQGVAGGTLALGPWDPRVSPDDSKIAYDIGLVSTMWDWSCNCYQQTTEYETLYTDVGQFTDPSVYGVIRDYSTPSWIDDEHTLLTANGIGIDQFAVYLLGGGDTDPAHFSQWFNDNSSPQMAKAQLARTGGKLVVLAGQAAENIGIYSLPAPPLSPQTPTLECVINEPGTTGTAYDDPTWAPDGGHLAYAQPAGIYVTPIGDMSGGDCTSIAPQLLVPGGSQPFWGPVDVAPADGMQSGSTNSISTAHPVGIGQPASSSQPAGAEGQLSGERPGAARRSCRKTKGRGRHHRCGVSHRHKTSTVR